MHLFRRGVLASAIVALSFSMIDAAQAECRRQDGYIYVYASCVTQERQHPQNICQRSKSQPPSIVNFVSVVVHDRADNRVYPSGVFFDAIGSQYGISLNGNDSSCYRSRDDAERAKLEFTGGRRRSNERIVTVTMPNS